MIKHLIYFSCFFVACNQSPEVDKVKLSGSEKYIFLTTKGAINPKSKNIHYFENEGNSWLFYGNREQNELIIYQLPSGEIEKRITFERHGPDGIGGYRGVLAHSFDSIFLVSATFYNNFFLTDTTGKIKQKYSPEPIGNNQMPPAIRSLSSHLSNPGIYHNGRINLSTYLFTDVTDENLHNEIIDFEFDIEKKKIIGFANYPMFDGKTKDNGYSRTFDGKQFIYSFQRKDIVHLQKNNGTYSEYYCGSRYRTKSLDWSVKQTNSMTEIQKTNLENPWYIDILYDKQHKVYYRFFLPGYNLPDDKYITKHFDYPAKFSIIMLDDNLNLLGETLLPEKTYDPYMKFIGKDGLYLALHIDHPMYNSDSLAFEKMEIIRK
jgi:hypothetical protein